MSTNGVKIGRCDQSLVLVHTWYEESTLLVDVCPPLFTLLQLKMSMDGIRIGWCNQSLVLVHMV